MATLWAALAWREWQAARRPLAGAALALCALGAAFLCVQESGQIATKVPDSALVALARSAGGGRTLAARAATAHARAGRGRARTRRSSCSCARSVPRTAPLLIAVEPVDATEALIRLDRSDVLPIGAAEQDGLVRTRRGAAHPRGARRALRHVRGDAGRARSAWPSGASCSAASSRRCTRRGRFQPVAAAAGYRVFRLSCRA